MAAETPQPSPATGGTRLVILLQESAEAEPVEYILECIDGRPGPETTLPNGAAACELVAALGPKFFTARPDKNLICTQVYGGPQTARITGTIDGNVVRARFARTDGCEISRWNAVQGILGAGGDV